MIGYLVAAGAALGAWWFLKGEETAPEKPAAKAPGLLPGAAGGAGGAGGGAGGGLSKEGYMAAAIAMNRDMADAEKAIEVALERLEASGASAKETVKPFLEVMQRIIDVLNKHRDTILLAPESDLSIQAKKYRAQLANAELPLRYNPLFVEAAIADAQLDKTNMTESELALLKVEKQWARQIPMFAQKKGK